MARMDKRKTRGEVADLGHRLEILAVKLQMTPGAEPIASEVLAIASALTQLSLRLW